jgi:hypothetical protein
MSPEPKIFSNVEAIPLFKQGKKLRSVRWGVHRYVYLNKHTYKNEKDETCDFNITDGPWVLFDPELVRNTEIKNIDNQEVRMSPEPKIFSNVEAIQLFRQGKKLRSVRWDVNQYVYLDKYTYKNEKDETCDFSLTYGPWVLFDPELARNTEIKNIEDKHEVLVKDKKE